MASVSSPWLTTVGRSSQVSCVEAEAKAKVAVAIDDAPTKDMEPVLLDIPEGPDGTGILHFKKSVGHESKASNMVIQPSALICIYIYIYMYIYIYQCLYLYYCEYKLREWHGKQLPSAGGMSFWCENEALDGTRMTRTIPIHSVVVVFFWLCIASWKPQTCSKVISHSHIVALHFSIFLRWHKISSSNFPYHPVIKHGLLENGP